jgi:phage shock protein A
MSTTIIQAEDWITRADMAALMKRSEDTVRRAEKKHELKTREDEARRALVAVADFLRLGLIRPQDLTVGATPAESAEVLRARETVAALKAQVAEMTGRLAQTDLVRDTLREQLAVKD